VKSKTYVVSWDRVYKNSLDIDSQLFRAGLDYLVYNDSSMPELNSNWVRAKKVFFLGHFYNSLKDFIETDYPVFIFNAGDAVYSDYIGLTKKAESILTSDPDCWAYAPSTNGTDVWSWDGSSIVESKLYPGLHLSTHTNAIWVAISRDLVEIVFKFFEWMFENGHFDREFKHINTGWGVDSFFCALSICMDKKVYRDWNCAVGHSSDTSYDHGVAWGQMLMTIKKSVDFTTILGIEPEKMSKTYDIMYNKVNTRRKLTLSDLYTNVDFDV